MPTKRPAMKGTRGYPLQNNGCFTWNKKQRRMLFMRAANPDHPNAERHYMQQFFLEGDDIKHLYQVLHEHYQNPIVIGRSTGEWFDDAAKPEQYVTVQEQDPERPWAKIKAEKPHEKYPDVELPE